MLYIIITIHLIGLLWTWVIARAFGYKKIDITFLLLLVWELVAIYMILLDVKASLFKEKK